MKFGSYTLDYTFLLMAIMLIIIPWIADAPLLWTGAMVSIIIGLKKIQPERDDCNENQIT